MKLKRIITIILAMIICILPLSSALAAPESFYGNPGSSSYGLMTIKNPEAVVSSTANKICVVSAVANPGTTITLYSYSSATGKYHKMYSNGYALESTVGAAGLFAQNISLKTGTNSILVYATYGGQYQTVKLDITLLKSSVVDNGRNILQTIIN